MLYLYVLLILISETTAFSFLKKFSVDSNWAYLALGLFFYALVAMFLVRSFRYGDMGIVNVLWSAFSVLAVAGVGVLYYREHLSAGEMGGMFLIMVGVAVLKL